MGKMTQLGWVGCFSNKMDGRLQMAEEHMNYLLREKCPHCTRRNDKSCNFSVTPRPEGRWQCHGFHSRYWDEPFDFVKSGARAAVASK